MIGDPTGRSKTRPPLTAEEIAANAETYKTQVFKILDREKTVVDFNSRWLGALGAAGMVKLSARYNVAQMLERRDFKQRYEAGKPIAVHEFLYPLAQAYDSVFLEADVELGGTDQLFNLNVGRDLMPGYQLEAQVVMTTPLLEGLDGVEKMSKSLGNYVGVTEPPAEMFGKLMSISDELMWRYYLLLTDVSTAEVDALRARVSEGALHPKQAKVDLAKRIVADFHSRRRGRPARPKPSRRSSRAASSPPTSLARDLDQGRRFDRPRQARRRSRPRDVDERGDPQDPARRRESRSREGDRHQDSHRRVTRLRHPRSRPQSRESDLSELGFPPSGLFGFQPFCSHFGLWPAA